MKDKYKVEFNEKEIRYLGYTMSMHLQKMEDDIYYGNRDLTLLKNLVNKINKEKYRDLTYSKDKYINEEV
jgi:hypothetical protein